MGKDLLINSKIKSYIENFSKELHPVQKEIISYNKSLGEIKKMQISISQCYFLELITKISKAKKILEIGTFTGLSTLSMALGLPNEGLLISLDKNKKTCNVASSFFKKANQDKKIKAMIKPALESLNEIKKEKIIFDIIFIDADKNNYKNYYKKCMELLKPKGCMVIDNMLWGGEVLDPKDKESQIIAETAQLINKNNTIYNTMLAIRDGLMLCIKK